MVTPFVGAAASLAADRAGHPACIRLERNSRYFKTQAWPVARSGRGRIISQLIQPDQARLHGIRERLGNASATDEIIEPLESSFISITKRPEPYGWMAAYLVMPGFGGPVSFLVTLADAQVTGEYRDHAPRYPRRPG
jgi:hypothetical protein